MPCLVCDALFGRYSLFGCSSMFGCSSLFCVLLCFVFFFVLCSSLFRVLLCFVFFFALSHIALAYVLSIVLHSKASHTRQRCTYVRRTMCVRIEVHSAHGRVLWWRWWGWGPKGHCALFGRRCLIWSLFFVWLLLYDLCSSLFCVLLCFLRSRYSVFSHPGIHMRFFSHDARGWDTVCEP